MNTIPDLVSFPVYTDSMLLKIDVLDVHITELRHTDTCRVDRPDNQFVPWIFNGIDQTEDLAVLEEFYFLLLDARTFNTTQGVCYNRTLHTEKTIQRPSVEIIR